MNKKEFIETYKPTHFTTQVNKFKDEEFIRDLNTLLTSAKGGLSTECKRCEHNPKLYKKEKTEMYRGKPRYMDVKDEWDEMQ